MARPMPRAPPVISATRSFIVAGAYAAGAPAVKRRGGLTTALFPSHPRGHRAISPGCGVPRPAPSQRREEKTMGRHRVLPSRRLIVPSLLVAAALIAGGAAPRVAAQQTPAGQAVMAWHVTLAP